MIKTEKNITKTVIINGKNTIIKIQDPKKFDIKSRSDYNYVEFKIYIKNTNYTIWFTKNRQIFNSLLCDIYNFFNYSKYSIMIVYKNDNMNKMYKVKYE